MKSFKHILWASLMLLSAGILSSFNINNGNTHDSCDHHDCGAICGHHNHFDADNAQKSDAQWHIELKKEWLECPVCMGSGQCKYCSGTGKDKYMKDGRCGVCRGTGKCSGCNGKGGEWIRYEEVVDD